MSQQLGFRAGQVVLVPHNGCRRRVQIRNVKIDAVTTWLVYFVDRTPYRCPAKFARPVF
ncbi:hypothetical protein H6F43_07595 [Leptolyngbya sp. FACHB-36]|uniref:hypothetical protein n=1 Tax=Leptolyngbya sp. FACHB-36 TaxID=2692808 RepID=UPI0016812899|nr:hypothetical protein [Leptolyngbya sp. FACHB-36]MBD2020048.1 hypothetical protein [Leptolyngbya sp. FACHB-36]